MRDTFQLDSPRLLHLFAISVPRITGVSQLFQERIFSKLDIKFASGSTNNIQCALVFCTILGVQLREKILFVSFQVGLLCYLAHVGSFVPAVSAKVRDQRSKIYREKGKVWYRNDLFPKTKKE